MRNQWLRLLLLRHHTPCRPSISQVQRLRSLSSSLLHPPASQVTLKPLFLHHHFTSSPEIAVEPPKPPSDQATMLTDIFAEPGRSSDEIKLDLEAKNVAITHDLILNVLKNPDTDTDVAKRVFDWVLESQSEKLSSKSYNWMLGILGASGFVQETWDMIGIMKRKGYGVSKGAFVRIFEKFEKDGLSNDVEKLKEICASGSAISKNNDANKENSNGKVSCRISKIIQSELWGDDVEKQLQELNVEFSGDLVATVLENLEMEPNKALIFFRWVQESGLFKHDQRSFNTMARVLSREDHSQKFWRLVTEMRSEGHELERETYVHISEQFVKTKMMKDAEDLYEFAMMGGNKPSAHDCTFLLKKIVVSKEELDMGLFLKVVRVFTTNGSVLTEANMNAILKSLTSVGRMSDFNRILLAMEEAGYVPSDSSQSKIAFKLSSSGEKEEALTFLNNLASQHSLDDKTWVSLIKGYCEARDLDEASKSFREMVEKDGATCVGQALDILVGTFCRKNKPLDAYKFVEMVNEKGLNPWHTTYKALTSKLLAKKHLNEALGIMNMMKNQGYPPDLDSFLRYLSKTGTADDAVKFSQVFSKRFPTTSVYLQLFEGYFKSGRQSEAQDFLSKCPSYIKNHADILNLFSSRKSDQTRTAAVAV